MNTVSQEDWEYALKMGYIPVGDGLFWTGTELVPAYPEPEWDWQYPSLGWEYDTSYACWYQPINGSFPISQEEGRALVQYLDVGYTNMVESDLSRQATLVALRWLRELVRGERCVHIAFEDPDDATEDVPIRLIRDALKHILAPYEVGVEQWDDVEDIRYSLYVGAEHLYIKLDYCWYTRELALRLIYRN